MSDDLWRQAAAPTIEAPTILIVDDDPTVLDTLEHLLGTEHRVLVAADGPAALALLEEHGAPVAVISDLKMPGMDGIELLGQIQQLYPETSRILHTAQADLTSALAAINASHVLHMLTKPASATTLRATVREAVHHHRLAVAEHELLDKTLRTSLDALFGCLQLASPQAFARAGRIRDLVDLICRQLELTNVWEIEVAAMASQLGAVTVPPSVLAKRDAGVVLPDDEQRMIDAIPRVAVRLLADIPRLDVVVDIVRGLYEDGVHARESAATARVRVAVMVLRAAIAYEGFRGRGMATDRMLSVLTADAKIDPEILAALGQVHGTATTDAAVTAYRIAELEVGMRIAEDVVGANGAILIGSGMQVTDMLVERLTNFQCKGQLVEPVMAGWPGGTSSP
jgi:response regulator RpfG family c-di-GMP phosphodiesterase